ncbi:MAG: hypothetical protein OHK0031_12740 [Anaerolineales bacterium]
MISSANLVESLLKEACLLTGCCWSVSLTCQGELCRPGENYRLTRRRENQLNRFLAEKSNLAWLFGVFSAGRTRSRVFSSPEGDLRLYAFPCADGQTLLLAACQQELSAAQQRIWRLVSLAHLSGGQTARLEQAVLELEETQQELQARITAQREAEARLVQAAKLAAVGEMAAGVAHELNNPLTSVVGFTELSLDALPPDSPVRGDLDLVLREAQRARSVVRRLLDFARQGETVRVLADINEVVEDVVALTKHFLQTSGVRLEIRLGADLPRVRMDRNQIKQVLINLVNNALYAMPSGGTLVLQTSLQERYAARWLRLDVRDTGVGIPAENLGRIFEPFFTTRAERGGSGLGLSVTYGIVTDHRGRIEVESEPGHGSIFSVWLPLEAEA